MSRLFPKLTNELNSDSYFFEATLGFRFTDISASFHLMFIHSLDSSNLDKTRRIIISIIINDPKTLQNENLLSE